MSLDILLLAIVIYMVIIIFGPLFNKYLRLPWMFTVVVLGLTLSAVGLFQNVLKSDTFIFLSKMGMLIFLFIIGVDLEMEKIRQMGKYIIFGDILLTLSEGLLV